MDNKEIILNKAIELFSLKGYNGTGIQEIASASGVGKPTLYYYYGSKDGLLNGIFQIHFRHFLDILKKSSAYNHDITLTITELTKSILTFAGENRKFYTMILSMSFEPEESPAWKIISSYIAEMAALIQDVFIKAESDHGNMRGRSEYLSMSFLGMVNSYSTLIIRNRKVISDDFIYTIVHQFMHGIFS